MSDGEALLAAIRANPDEDTPRLVYADWLDEQGAVEESLRAEFIRLTVAHAAAKGTYWQLGGKRNRPTRLKDLVRVRPWMEPDVMAEVRRGTGYVQPSSNSSAVLWRRGFIEAVLCSGVSLAGVLDDLRGHPIREMQLSSVPFEATCERLVPGWGHGTNFTFHANRNEILGTLLTGPGGFPHLQYARIAFERPGQQFTPFDMLLPDNLARAGEIQPGS